MKGKVYFTTYLLYNCQKWPERFLVCCLRAKPNKVRSLTHQFSQSALLFMFRTQIYNYLRAFRDQYFRSFMYRAKKHLKPKLRIETHAFFQVLKGRLLASMCCIRQCLTAGLFTSYQSKSAVTHNARHQRLWAYALTLAYADIP